MHGSFTQCFTPYRRAQPVARCKRFRCFLSVAGCVKPSVKPYACMRPSQSLLRLWHNMICHMASPFYHTGTVLYAQVKLKHVETGVYLASSERKYGRPISGQQEVCGRKKADWWAATEGVYFPERPADA